MLKEGPAMEFVRSRIPDPTAEQRRRGIISVLADLAKNGVTSVQDNSDWEDFRAYKLLKDDGKLTVRITEWLHFTEPLNDLQNKRAEGGTTDPWLKTGALKMVTDGALGSRTAAMLEPYSDDAKTTGIMIMEPDKLKSLAIERDKAGFQLNFHAIGDRANRFALDVFEAVAKANGPRDRRDRIEHAQVVAPDDLLGGIAHWSRAHQGRLRMGHLGKKRRASRFRHRFSRRSCQPLPRTLRLRHTPASKRHARRRLAAARKNLFAGLHPRVHQRLGLCGI